MTERNFVGIVHIVTKSKAIKNNKAAIRLIEDVIEEDLLTSQPVGSDQELTDQIFRFMDAYPAWKHEMDAIYNDYEREFG